MLAMVVFKLPRPSNNILYARDNVDNYRRPPNVLYLNNVFQKLAHPMI